jgi:pimeloyl-ACP methyl ester carboxylesterase
LIKKIGLAVLAIVSCIVVVALYNYIRHYVYWSPTEEVSFTSGDIRLAGTLVKPNEDGIFPAIIFMHGSGREKRNDPPNRAVVNTLVRNGFAVLVYDKRGAGKSGGDFDSAGYRDFIDDGISAVNFLADRPDIDSENIGLHTVSESGWFGPEIAMRTQRIAFIFNKAGPPLSWVDTVKWEVRNDFVADGIAETDVSMLVDLIRRKWTYYQNAADDPEFARGPEREAINRQIAELRKEIPMADQVLDEEMPPYNPDLHLQYVKRISYDPGPFLNKIDIPMYYTFAELDVNIPTRESVAALEALVEEQGKDIGIFVFPGVGHSFMSWSGILNLGWVPGYLDIEGEWTAEQVNND